MSRIWRPDASKEAAPPRHSDTAKGYDQTSRRSYIKLDKYDGKRCVDTFLAHFDTAAEHNGWAECDLKAQLLTSLTGDAADLINNCKGLLTYENLRQKLQSKYGTENRQDVYIDELQQRRQKTGEGLTELAHEIERLSVFAYPDMTPEQLDKMINLPAFLNAMSDLDLSIDVRKQKPKTLRDALDEATRIERWNKSKRDKEASKPKNVRFVHGEGESKNTGDRGPPQRRWDRSGRPNQGHPPR